MDDIPVAERINNTIHVSNAKLQEPIFYDPESDRTENYIEFHRRKNKFVNTKMGKIIISLLLLIMTSAFCYIIYKGANEDEDEDKIDSLTNLTYEERLYMNYLNYGGIIRRLA
tara:strand:- start:5081 stop:5419 length:339 start_codon:yes stop_codon:yes gene_type:complete